MSENFNYCHVVGKTDVGRKRAANEDNMYNAITQNGLVSVVCDGMGGHVGGATASKIAVSAIIDNLNNIYYDDPRIAIGESIDKANKEIIQKTIEQPELSGMGSTCVLLLVRDGKVYIGHVGDSRIYLIRSKRIVQLTKDHSYVQMLVDCGEITKEQAEHHPRKNEITNALGIPNMSPATVAKDAIIPEAGDCFVLCSDGLSGMVSDDTICKIISRQSEMTAQERVDKLVALANENGGLDNITVQLVEFSVSPNTNEMTKKRIPKWAKITLGVVILAVFSVGVYLWLRTPIPSDIEKDTSSQTDEEVIECESHDFGNICFEENTTIVELEYNDSSLILKRDKNEIGRFNSAFDNNTLKIETPNIETKYNNSLIAFTDTNPGDSIVFYITQSDKKKTCKCKFTISNHTEEKSKKILENIPLVIKNSTVEEVKEDRVTTTKMDTIRVQFEYTKLKKGTTIILGYSAKPFLRFDKKEEKAGEVKLESIIVDSLKYDYVYWGYEHNKNNQQLIFKSKGECSEKELQFIIPCKVENSDNQIVIDIKLIPQKGKDKTGNGKSEDNVYHV